MSVVRIRRHKGEIVQDCDVYIGRQMNMGGWHLKASIWANPYKLKDYNNDIDKVLKLYKKHIIKSGLIDRLHELKGKVLGCWCKPNKCHGDVLLQLIEIHC